MIEGPGETILTWRARCDGAVQPCRVVMPRRWRRRYPVVVALHGFGGRMADFPPAARHLADAFGWVLLAPDGRGNQHWDGAGEDDVFEALDELARHVPLDPDRIYLHGGSMGGHGALRLAFRFPWRFAAVSAVAGWISAGQMYPKWYGVPGEPAPAVLEPLLEAAVPWTWREAARHLPGRLAWGDQDRVNEAPDSVWLAAWLRHAGRVGGRGWRLVPAEGGHGAGMSWVEVLRFFWGQRRRPLRHLVSPTLRHAAGGWFRAERLIEPGRSARFAVETGPRGLTLRAENVAALTLWPDAASPWEADWQGQPPGRGPVRVVLEEGESEARPGGGEVLVGPRASGFAKQRGTDGPIAELFRAPFQVIAPDSGPQHDAALRFCALWNAWLTCRWPGGEARPVSRDWWRPPYPWPVGSHLPADPGLLQPVPEQAARPDCHWMIFGGPGEVELVARFRDAPARLPIRPLDDGLVAGDETFRGEAIGYLALHPIPWQPDRLMLLCRHWLDSAIDPAEAPPGVLGKDLESLPWSLPDLVIFDHSQPCRLGVQPPLRHLPDAWLLAATFGPGWGWSGAEVWRPGLGGRGRPKAVPAIPAVPRCGLP